ncbi:hypothetical protein VFPPC_18262 [Pochonia chlamydosporia 170]|uniref:Uncharacterized protein n=1 Tax=Pochonia chlamydosporia 170 TaxID=1380566 RepID=A0A219AQM3_METCM|nr:hypothetical protein VFPPC_18262 [Pochonia chlamydosporia 170]OWT42594.1 hypothetical protein VFPPC_18262 [Pochonia chlamydosporia 170]
MTWDLTSLFVACISKSTWPLRPMNVKLSPCIVRRRLTLGSHINIPTMTRNTTQLWNLN